MKIILTCPSQPPQMGRSNEGMNNKSPQMGGYRGAERGFRGQKRRIQGAKTK